MRRGGILALACAVSAGAALPGAASRPPFKPSAGKYRDRVAGTSSPNSLTLQVRRRNRASRARILKLNDDCAGALLPVPRGLGRVFAKDIKYETSGVDGALTWRVKVEGKFTSAKRATVRVRSYQNDPAPPPGSSPSAAIVCRDDTSFALRLKRGGR